ncbi:hypothetical protein N2152v2_004912 [Parachlorella kessleri]
MQHVLPPGEDTPWLEHSSLPLKWHVPAGVLFDLLAGEGELPWSLTLHLRGYPSGVLPVYDGEPALRGSLLNSLKEAAFICRGSSLRVMEMSPGAQEDLYRSVAQQDLPLYRRVLQSLQLAPTPRAGRQPAIPLRLFVRTGGRGYLSSYEGIGYTSRAVECQRPDGTLVTLQEGLLPILAEYLGTSRAGPAASAAALLPGLVAPSGAAQPAAPMAAVTAAAAAAESAGPDSEPPLPQPPTEGAEVGGTAAAPGAAAAEGEGRTNCSDSQPPRTDGSEAGGGVGEGASEAAAVEPAGAGEQQAARQGEQARGTQVGVGVVAGVLGEVLVGGVRPPLETPLAWLHANMHAADLFLYIVVHVNGNA